MDTQTSSQEIWRKSPLAPDHVEVSNFGRVRTQDRKTFGLREGKPAQQLKKGKVISPWLNRSGYYAVAVKIGASRSKYAVHRLVASAFCDNFDPSLTVNHMDGNKLNNQASNLEWVTLARNSEHQWETGLVDLRGEKHPGSKITDDQARNIKKAMLAGISPTVLARAIGVSVSLCYKIKEGSRHNV